MNVIIGDVIKDLCHFSYKKNVQSFLIYLNDEYLIRFLGTKLLLFSLERVIHPIRIKLLTKTG